MRRSALAAGLLVSSVVAAVVTTTATTATSAETAATTLVAVNRVAEVGLAGRRTETYSATPVEYNRNGVQDVLIGYHGLGGKLWHNKGGTYTRVARSAWPGSYGRGLHVDRHDCAWADVDRNGLPDAYCSTGRMRRNVVKTGRDNELWLQVRRGEFREVGTRWGVGDRCGRGRQVAFLNANGDRWPDLFLGNDVPRRDPDDPCAESANRLPNMRGKVFINVRGNRFRYAKARWNFGPGIGTRCAVPFDFDHDGWQDLLACRGPSETPRLYRNRSGRGFADVTARFPFNEAVSDAVVVDLDGDGDRDLVASSDDGFGYYPAEGDRFLGRVLIGTLTAGQGGSVAVGDADADGDMDVYGLAWSGVRGNPDDQIWINGAGATFSPIPVPPAGGAGDDVVALDPRGTGRAAFLVLNGYGAVTHGRIQYIQVVRR
jgi:hypothetical protein